MTSTQVTEGLGSSRALRRAFWLRSTMRSASSTMMTRRVPSMGDSDAWATASRIASIGYVYPLRLEDDDVGVEAPEHPPADGAGATRGRAEDGGGETLAANSLPVPGGPANG